MKVNVRGTRTSADTLNFEFSAAGAPYSGYVRAIISDGTPQHITVSYTNPRNEVITKTMRDTFDPFIIELAIRELSSNKDT